MAFYFFIVLAFVATCQAGSTTGIESDNTRSPVCKTRNGFYKMEASCDSYVECKDYVAVDMLCPDGLVFNPDAEWPSYPCGYPMDVPCLGRGSTQPAQPTADCPHQYGFFRSPDAASNSCGEYRMCIEGRAIDMVCPSGLAFDPASGRCDWPHLVSSCKVDDFLGFACPAAPLDAFGQPLDIIMNYKYEDNCSMFFSCVHGYARLLSCDAGLAFDPALGRCVDADLVQCGQKKI